MAARVQKVRKRARPWRSYIAAVLAIAGAVAARYWGVPSSVTIGSRIYAGAEAFSHASPEQQIITVGGAAAFLIFGLAAVLGLSAKARSSLLPVVGEAHAAVVRYVLVGLVLLFARPFRVGDRVRFRAGALSGTIEGVVVDISLTYVRLGTEDGPALVPNSQALAASVLLVPDDPDETGGATTN